MRAFHDNELQGYVERITFRNDDNGFTILQVKTPGMKDLVCVVGNITAIQIGETIKCKGGWKNHPQFGRQFQSDSCEIKAPADLLGIQKYLGSGLIKGIGPIYAEKMTKLFGIDTLNVLDTNPDKLKLIKGFGKKRIELIASCFKEQKQIRDVMVFLQGHGVSPAFAQKIYKTYANRSIEVVNENPYRLAKDIFGIGFKIADQIAAKLGFLKEAEQRIDAGIEYVLRELSDEGHTCYPRDQFLIAAESILEVESSKIEHRVIYLIENKQIEQFDLIFQGVKKPFLWSRPLFNAEIGIATRINTLLKATSSIRPVDVLKAITWVQEKLGIILAPAQIDAVSQSLISKVLIITGGPGTGKSTITNAILKISEKLTSRILLAAPTGRAAKRMGEITGKTAKTIHSLLEVDFKAGGFKRGKDNPLECDLLIVDEASMIDTKLMHSLLKAVPDGARVIFVGDIDQLPSVGAGNVLQDMIESYQVPVKTLNEIFRQAEGSQIIVNAHRINKGLLPNTSYQEDSDFYFIDAEEPEMVLQKILSLVSQRLPRKFKFNAINDIQVLAPMKKGIVGTENLNTLLQETLNPQTESLQRTGRKYQVSDKVMQIRNNYEKQVFNGDVGRIENINFEEGLVDVLFDDKIVTYQPSELDELVLAYAVSVHKYQGSECPCVVMPLHTTHFKLLQRNLLYTGVTRGKKLVVLVGNRKGLQIAVSNNEVELRYTGLKQALLGMIG